MTRSSLTLAALVFLAAQGLLGCAVGPEYTRPPLALDDRWSAAASPPEAARQPEGGRWWTALGDSLLDELVETALRDGPDVAIAAGRLREARALAGLAEAEGLPTLDATAEVSRARSRAPGAVTPTTGTTFRAGLDASWELDLFGRARRASEAAVAGAEAAGYDVEAARLSLAAEVATTYVDLRAAQEELATTRRALESRRTGLELARDRREAGLGDELDVARASADLAGVSASIPPLEAGARVAVHRLGVLVGRSPGALAARLAAPRPVPPAEAAVPTGAPAGLLARRPDVAAAERALAAACAEIGVAMADRLPRLDLLAAFGFVRDDAGLLLRQSSRAWSIVPGLHLPLFDGGRGRARVEAARARYDAARAAWAGTAQRAAGEVEDALARIASLQARQASLQEAADAGERALRLATARYTGGLATFLDVLVAERTLLEADVALARSRAALAREVVALFKALGGPVAVHMS